MKKILVIDGNSIINRAFYGVRPLTTKAGKHTNAIFGMINIISRQLNTIKPDYAAVAFDLKHPTFRHERYPEYKAGRHTTPEELLSQFPDAKECLELMGIHVLEMPGYEADDLQGTVAKMAYNDDDTESYVLSGDRDLLQLIDERTTVLLATNSDTLTMKRDEFYEKYGIEPSQFVDMKALMGDSSDNIPGVGGVGEKTAANLIKEFGSLDAIYESIDDTKISKGVREKLIRDKEKAYLSQFLARINTEVPVSFALEELKYTGFNRPALYAKFTELELNSFITKFSLSAEAEMQDGTDSSAPKCDIPSAEYKEITSDELLLLKGRRFAFDMTNEAMYFTLDCANYSYTGGIKDILGFFEGCEMICYDAKPILHRLADEGADISEIKALDIMLYSYVLNPGTGTGGICSLASMFLSHAPSESEPKSHIMPPLESAMLEKIKADGLEKILFELELPLINILAETERNGFKINRDGIREFGDALGALMQDLTTNIYKQAGKEFNINSPKQLGEVLFVDLALPFKKKKKQSGYSTDAQTLEELRPLSPIIDDILEYRQVAKLRSTYTAVLPEVADEGGRIHTDFKQALTATGRLSSADPNLQNIPIRTKMGREMRRYFIAEDGYTLIDADYSQIELRLLAHISGDYNMTESFKNGYDIHRKTAAAVFGVDEAEVTDEMRKRAKAVNFGIIYGIGGFSLAKDIGTTTAEASRYIKSYLYNYPGIDMYLEKVVEDAKRDGYTVTPWGRRRYIPELNAQNGMLRAFGKRVAMNAPIQGAAADIMKLAMINVAKRLKKEGLDAKLVMQVHDELIVEAAEKDKERCKAIVKEEMESAASLNLPLTVDVTEGKNWLEQS